ncbi:class I SAM-dependent DNA methyltransferase [Pontimicrobium sp. IMCC45349]|uniref:class I SAM-dependent DNA methyltransferase n=1 Tax=Pontimicrobium sp. IMCC45349 TaxID=3391574 RepID=UPI0039A1DEE1
MDQLKNTTKIFNDCAQEYENKFMNVDLYSDSLNLFCKQIEKHKAKILEIACGPGNITKYLLDKRPDYKILGLDIAPKMITLAKQNNPTANFKVMDCRAITNIKETFDAIMCGFAFPYFTKQEALTFIKDAYSLLNPNGIIYISTMEGKNSTSGYKLPSSGEGPELFINYHETEYLIKALKENNFEITHQSLQDYPEYNSSASVDLILIAKK